MHRDGNTVCITLTGFWPEGCKTPTYNSRYPFAKRGSVHYFLEQKYETWGKWENDNRLHQLDYSVCGSKALQTPNYKHGKQCKCGIARIPQQEHLCAPWSPRGNHQQEKGGQLKHLYALAALSISLQFKHQEAGWWGGKFWSYIRCLWSLLCWGDPHNLSADSYDWGEMLTLCTAGRLQILSCNSRTNYYFHHLIRLKNVSNIHCITYSLLLYGKNFLSKEKRH